MDLDVTIGNDVTMRAGSGASLGKIDQYELVRELGGGGFGTVFLARDTVAGIDVAVKGLPPLVRNNKEELENVRRNFALVSRLHHPHIAAALVLHPVQHATYAERAVAERLRVFDGDFLVVMEFAPGVTLSQWRKQFDGGRVPMAQAREIVRQIADALDYAHAVKIIHRDIKPANVMIETREDGSVVARVLDFGLAAEVRSSMGRISQQVTDTSGTRPYMAPEQWLGKKQGAATDQYALAVLFYELVTGEVPFASVFETGDPVVMMNVVGREPPELAGDIPFSLRRTMLRALAKTPDERFGSCGEFAAALLGGRRHAAGGSGVRRFALAALLVVLGGAALVSWRIFREKPVASPAPVRAGEEVSVKPPPAQTSKVTPEPVRTKESEQVAAQEPVQTVKPKPARDIEKICQGLRLECEDPIERQLITEYADKVVPEGHPYLLDFDDYRKADWSNANVILGMGLAANSSKKGRKADPEVALWFCQKAQQMGNAHAAKEIEKLKRTLAEKPLLDAIASGSLEEIKAHVNKGAPHLDFVSERGLTLFELAAGQCDATVLEFLASLGHDPLQENPKTGKTPLFAACGNTNGVRAVSCLEWLVKHGADLKAPNYKAGEYADPLPIFHVTTLQAFNFLVGHGVDVHGTGSRGNSLLHAMAKYGRDAAIVQRVIALLPEQVNAENDEGATPLILAAGCWSDHACNIVRLLLDSGAKVDARVGKGYEQGFQAIHAAAHISSFRDQPRSGAVIELLCERGADVNAVVVGNGTNKGKSALMLAAENGNVPAVRALLDCKANVQQRCSAGKDDSRNGYQAIHFVEAGDNPEAVLDLLLAKTAKIDDKVADNPYTTGDTLLHIAANDIDKFAAWRLIRALLKRKADISIRGAYDRTPVDVACDCGKYYQIRAFGDAGVKLADCRGPDGESPLHYVADKDEKHYPLEKIVTYLLSKGCAINCPQASTKSFYAGRTPLHAAADRGEDDGARILLAHGANVNARSECGETPLWLACDDYKPNLTLIKRLLDAGAEPNPANKNGERLLDQVKDKPEVCALLRQYAERKQVTDVKPPAEAKMSTEVKSSSGKTLSEAARRLVGTWSCRCSVTYKDSLGSRADDTIKRFLPVSSVVRLRCEEDGTVELSDSSGRSFGHSSGTWKYRHGMLIMDLRADDGRSFRLSGVINWRGAEFELHYDNGEFANMIRMSCESSISDLNAVISSYVDGQLEVSISTKTPSFKMGTARCSAHVFARQQ